MKALDILIYLRKYEQDGAITPYLIRDYNEAIAELEAMQALQSPKTCEYCRFFNLRMDGFNYCDRHPLMNGLVYSDFGCVHFEPKDTQ